MGLLRHGRGGIDERENLMTNPVAQTDRARNINLWKDAEVYVSHDDTAQVNADGTFDPETWSFVGLLNAGSPIGQDPDITRNDIQSFGGVLQIKDTKFNKDVRTFDALEDNETVFELMWPGSEFVPNGSGVIVAPLTDAEVIIAFKTENSYGDIYVDVSRRKASVYPSARDKNDDGASTTQFTADVMKDDEGGLYDYLRLRNDGTTPEVAPEVIRIKAAAPESP